MKNLRPVILWLLIAGIILAAWNNFFSRPAEKKQAVMVPQKPPSQEPSPYKSLPSEIKPVVQAGPKGPLEAKPQQGPSWLKEFGVLSGFSRGSLKDKDDYEIVPVIMRFGIDLKAALGKEDSNPKDLLEFEFEPFLGAGTSPDANAEIGAALLVKYGRFIFKKLCLYIEGGTGFIYLSQHTREQSTQFNFVDQAGGGIHYFIKRNIAINIGYRYRHVSNGSIKSPNKGIDSNMVLAGISWFY